MTIHHNQLERAERVHPSDQLIFISIAAYRDPQLVPTINDLLLKARHPGRLRFGICWQHATGDDPLPFLDDGRFRILDIDWRESRGACWARAQTMGLWQGEEWFLQVDSHCRFAPGWDETLIELMGQTGSAKPILSTYGSPFIPAQSPDEPEVLEHNPMLIAFQTFTQDKIPELRPVPIPNWRSRTKPMRARFIGAGFVFAPGRFVQDVPYDPELYFYGEETTMSLRAFTHGYDLFHPCGPLVWHEYTRTSATRHWDNHTRDIDGTLDWSELDTRSKDRVRDLLAGKPMGKYGLGAIRSLQEYEDYAGISLAHRKAQDYTRQCGEPPNPALPDNWPDTIHEWMARVRIDFLSLPPGALGDALSWYVTILDGDHQEIYRRNIPRAELANISGLEDTIVLICEFQSGTVPRMWTMQALSSTLGWLRKLGDHLADDDFAIIDDEETTGDELAQETTASS